MFKKYIIFLLISSFALAGEEIIEAGIKYNEASARIEAFSDVQRKIDKKIFSNYLKDPNYKENINSIKNNILIIENSRALCPFYLKDTLISYSIIYFNETQNTYYYNTLGNLIKADITNQNSYPKKIYGYSRGGKLINVTFEVSENEHFIYDEKGKLTAHWVGNNLLEKNNKEPKFLKLKRGEK